MRLWHYSLIPLLPRQQLLGQHRECCALRGAGWGRPHAVVNYVFAHSPLLLFRYHLQVMEEMQARGYKVEEKWKKPDYRGNFCPVWDSMEDTADINYPEHNAAYLEECLQNLARKGIGIDGLEGL